MTDATDRAAHGHEPPEAVGPAPLVAPPGTTPGPKGCMIALGLSMVFGLGSLFLSKVIFSSRNDSVIQGARELQAVMADAGAAPGASAVAALGCEAAGVLSPDGLRALGQRLEDEQAHKKGRPARTIDLGEDERVVFCARPDPGEPTCVEVAKAYVGAAAPAAPFVVTVRKGFGEKCAERFAIDGTSLGPAPSPNLPLLVAPR